MSGEWKRNGLEIGGETKTGVLWAARIVFRWVPKDARDPDAELDRVARLAHAAPRLRDMIAAGVDLDENPRLNGALEWLDAARSLLAELDPR